MSAEKGCSILDDVDLGVAQRPGGSGVRGTEQDRHFAEQRTRRVENGDLCVAAEHLDAALREDVEASGVLALREEDRSAGDVRQRRVAAVVEDGAHEPDFAFPRTNVASPRLSTGPLPAPSRVPGSWQIGVCDSGSTLLRVDGAALFVESATAQVR